MTFYFFDLETSGFRAKTDRIVQFGGQRVDMDLSPIGKPDNILVKMTPDTLPQPGAVLVHGITPQQTLEKGISEADFCKFLTEKVANEDTVLVGFNNIRFDNDFIRYTLWRNFHDPYEWSWRNGCSTWDLLDVVRMTRALRPEGIKWPFASDGRPSNKLEYLSSVNNLEHDVAHDALADVKASLALARLIKNKQPKLFGYLQGIRQKSKVTPLITKGEPIVYTSGSYPSEFEKTTVAVMIAEKPDKTAAIMYDLRIDPDEFRNLTPQELVMRWKDRTESAPYFPVKELKYNRCPAVAPISVLDDESAKRLQIHKEIIENHYRKIKGDRKFGENLLEAQKQLWPGQPQLITDIHSVDGQMYEKFIDDKDRPKMSAVRAAGAENIAKFEVDFVDERLKELLPLYRARNFPDALNNEQLKQYETFKEMKLLAGGEDSLAANYFRQIKELLKTPGMGAEKLNILKELEFYGRAILPDKS